MTSGDNIQGVNNIALDQEGNIYVQNIGGTIIRIDPETGAQHVVGVAFTTSDTNIAIEGSGDVIFTSGFTRLDS